MKLPDFPLRFDFGRGLTHPGFQKVTAEMTFTSERGYGLFGNVRAGIAGDYVTADTMFGFDIVLPEGNYDIKLALAADGAGGSETTVQAESRRLMLERVRVGRGIERRTITVNVRTPQLHSGGTVALKADEEGHLDWDDRLNLVFSGTRPVLAALEITPNRDVPTIYLAGDSTVTDQKDAPWCAWGQMLPRFFTSGIAVANHAESGESLSSFVAERRWSKICDTLRAGDYLFIQFAHNDQKAGPHHAEPFTTYTERVQAFADEARRRRAWPVLVTSMHRRRFDEQGHIVNTLGDYPEAMRRLARERSLPLIDLNAQSQILFEALGPEGSKRAFVHYAANTFPNQPQPLKDDTHFNEYGGYLLARCVVEGIRTGVPTLARFLNKDIPPFNPMRPDPPSSDTILARSREK